MILGQLVQEERLTGRTLVDPRGEGIHQVGIVAIDLLGLREVLQACALSWEKSKESASGKRVKDLESRVSFGVQLTVEARHVRLLRNARGQHG